MSRIDEIRKRVEAATPGPWRFDLNRRFIESLETFEKLAEGAYDRLEEDSYIDIADKNADLIANAPSDLAFLLAEVERLRKALDPIINAYCDYVLADDRSSDESIAQGQMEINIAEAGMELHGNSFLKDWEAMRRKRAGG
jgi:hypothetical protein